MNTLILFSYSFTCVVAHSWANEPTRRGPQRGSDQDLQRYYCPRNTLQECQPDPKHGIRLPPDAMRPCLAGQKSNPPTTIQAGRPFPVRWAGNGHANNQSHNTCVKISIAPYQSDPPREAFNVIPGAECLPYYTMNNGVRTEGQVTLPANTPNGEYTLFWLWDFMPFWFSSCMDIVVVGGNGAAAPPVPIVNTPAPYMSAPAPYVAHAPAPGPCANPASYNTPAPPAPVYSYSRSGNSVNYGNAPAPMKPMPPPAPVDNNGDDYKQVGCNVPSLGNSYCSSVFGTYCRSWQQDSCGRSVCHSDTHNSLYTCTRLLM